MKERKKVGGRDEGRKKMRKEEMEERLTDLLKKKAFSVFINHVTVLSIETNNQVSKISGLPEGNVHCRKEKLLVLIEMKTDIYP